MEIMKVLGLPAGFDSTKGKHVPGNCQGAVEKRTDRRYRQYMNRRGGFNRPLDDEYSQSRFQKFESQVQRR